MTARIGTRGSTLATTQTGHVADLLRQHASLHCDTTIITTPGDRSQAPVERIGVGVFTQALREAMAAEQCDIAVHSFKDLPTAPDTRFHLVVPRREDPRDALIARDGLTLATLPQGARVGTSAPRRVGQLRALRPDLDIQPLRGNIDSRMNRVTTGELDAVILAAAGLRRIGQLDRATEILDVDTFLPAPAQGALAVECPAHRHDLRAALDSISDTDATTCAAAERQILSTLNAGCTAPVAAHATNQGDTFTLTAGVFATNGRGNMIRRTTASRQDILTAADAMAKEMLNSGVSDLMD
ncbi:hydroxymethylbilane synthase [Corynebacterium aquilae]|uniref:Porphobilinogen deaminase n=1 Tax=Corynebacterium aquilae DSM 44791 TaxID=1431546 RepID=A0A1L7CDN6_9CORY|nr:hydroxymethylbilane synthase [Corynebacterium aquilae]APT83946.1 porphobilinogen deaminase [Corynebacterium aquilae DSM 44791]